MLLQYIFRTTHVGDIGATALRSGGVSAMSKSARDMDPNQYDVLFSNARGLEEVTRNLRPGMSEFSTSTNFPTF